MVEIKEKTLTQKANALSKIQNQYTPMLKLFQEGGQNYRILEHLIKRGTITQAEAVDNFKCYRLSARIADLRAKGINIDTEMVPFKSPAGVSAYAKYTLKGADE